ncbi:CBS domain-containing protein [Haloarchaeobius sp. HME9146]|uniref:CBS domain-containing protein n=1 Tax=Haloarchaeobius sp. HME9146 TaxID=2978732 RepID=UPI0021BE8066|nr:CBS domain-containing protein [Haloarchaeobius sp. HME9146]MCT9096999.1 MaoC/PaaZ C-terminal domain-containing protein [Haloarchaeobius sp. HME9146]
MRIKTLVRDVMQQTVESISTEATVRACAARLRDAAVGSLVVTSGGDPVGIVTKSDVVALVASGTDTTTKTAAEIMSSPVVTVPASRSVEHAADLLREEAIDQLVVTEGEALVGVLSVTELSYYLPRFQYEPVVEVEEDWSTSYEDRDDQGLSVGDVVRFSQILTETEVEEFAALSGDTNPLHLDDEYAAGTRFGGRIVHGALASSVISAALARLPGLVIYLSQNLTFRGPVELGDRVTAVCEVIDRVGEDRYRLRTDVFDTDEELVITGEAVVLVDDAPGTD